MNSAYQQIKPAVLALRLWSNFFSFWLDPGVLPYSLRPIHGPLGSPPKTKKIRPWRNRSAAGFTLIEVLIAIFVLVLIGTLTAKSIVEAAKLKQNLSEETDFANELRTSLQFMERDLNQVFNPRWLLPADHKPIDPYAPPQPVPPNPNGVPAKPSMTVEELNRRLNNTAFQTYEYWGPVLDFNGIRASRFKGDENKISFITSDHVRVYQQKKESIYAKVKYEFIKDTLYKIVNTHAFEVEEPRDAVYSTTYVILTKIKKLKFKYFKSGQKDPVSEWDSESSDGRIPKGMFPEAVELEVDVEQAKDRIITTKVLFKLETPNDVLPKTY